MILHSLEAPLSFKVVDRNATLNKGFRLRETRTLDVRIQVNNVFNMVTYSGINTTVNSTQFGQVTSAAPMRQMTIQMRYRF